MIYPKRYIAIMLCMMLSFNLGAQLSNSLTPKRKKCSGKVGFIKNGHWAIPAVYDSVLAFSDGLAAVKSDRFWGVIDESNNWVVEPSLNKIFPFKNGLAIAQEKGLWGVIDSKGEWKIKQQFDRIYPILTDNFQVLENGLWGIMKSSGSWALTPQFTALGSFNEGLCWASDKERNYGFLDEAFSVAINFVYADAGDFGNGLAPAKLKEGLWGYVDNQGISKIKPQFQFASGFQNGYAIVGNGASSMNYGLINLTGNVVFPEEYEEISNCNNGLYLMLQNGKYTFWNSQDSTFLVRDVSGAKCFEGDYAFLCRNCTLDSDFQYEFWAGGDWMLMDMQGFFYPLPKKFQTDYKLNYVNLLFSNSQLKEMQTSWIKKSSRLSKDQRK